MSESSEMMRALEALIEIFQDIGIAYYVGGSVASSAHGNPRSTMDVDLVADIPRRSIDALATALAQDFYADEDAIRDAVRSGRSFNVIHLPTMFKADVFPLTDDPWLRTAFDRAQQQGLLELEPQARGVHVASAEDILLHKLHWFQLGGEVSERQWRDVQGVLDIQSGALDLDYLHRWAAHFGVTSLLARAMDENTS